MIFVEGEIKMAKCKRAKYTVIDNVSDSTFCTLKEAKKYAKKRAKYKPEIKKYKRWYQMTKFNKKNLVYSEYRQQYCYLLPSKYPQDCKSREIVETINR